MVLKSGVRTEEASVEYSPHSSARLVEHLPLADPVDVLATAVT